MTAVGAGAAKRSWVEAANLPENGMPLESLPYCVFRMEEQEARIGVGIGGSVLDLKGAAQSGLLEIESAALYGACLGHTLNLLMGCGAEERRELRRMLHRVLREEAEAKVQRQAGDLLRERAEVQLLRPVDVPNYTDFYASVHHATNVGALFRPEQPLLPNYKHLPVGYHGRASSIVVSGTPVRRPRGQRLRAAGEAPEFEASRQLDFELEVGVYIAEGNRLGERVPIERADEVLFGVCVVNDWSARDIQAWEYQPLGPFLGKSFATSVSPWVVPMEALEGYRVARAPRRPEDPPLLPYLEEPQGALRGIDMRLEVYLSSERMRQMEMPSLRICEGNLQELYWSFEQMVAHHTSNGCNLVAGDLLASGTISGETDGSLGSLLEMTRRGARAMRLPSGEERTFLEDGDEVTLRGFCAGGGRPRIEIGRCCGRVLPSSDL